jgi:hypothetical protein
MPQHSHQECISIFRNLLRHLRGLHSNEHQIHHMYVEMHETAGCDEHMPEFSSVRDAMFSRLEMFHPGFVERIPKFKVSEADRDALQQNTAHFRHWLTTYVAGCSVQHSPSWLACLCSQSVAVCGSHQGSRSALQVFSARASDARHGAVPLQCCRLGICHHSRTSGRASSQACMAMERDVVNPHWPACHHIPLSTF